MNAYDKNIFENLPPQTATLNIVASYLKKYLLKETEDMLLYQQNCSTVLRESTELVDNEKNIEQNEERIIHRRSDVETQTYYSHSKTRFVHTEYVAKSEIGCFVSNYDMHDTYINLEYTTESVRIDADDHQEQLKIITYSKEDNNDLNHYLESNKSFQLSSMILQRILAGNIFYTKQKRFRNMSQVESPDLMPKYSYQIKLLCKYNEAHCNAISSMSWNPKNADILAIGYGVFKIQVQTECRSSAVCLWNIKNPVNPERQFKYDMPVTALCFSRDHPQLLAIGFFDSTIVIINISSTSNLIALSQRKPYLHNEPISQIKWIKCMSSNQQIDSA